MRAAALALAAAGALLLCAAPVAAWRIDGERLVIGERTLEIRNPFHPLALFDTSAGEAWRLDGYSTFAETAAPERIALASGFAVTGTLALASPPNRTASLLEIADADAPAGAPPMLRLGVDPWLRPTARFGDTLMAGLEPLDLGRWHDLALVFDGSTLRLVADGEEVAWARVRAPRDVERGIVTVGRGSDAGLWEDTHALGVLNGPVLDVSILTQRPRGWSPATAASGLAGSPADVAVPASRFADDRHRPAVHPVPPSGWTNEPHALRRADGLWHLYHQANPTGPFWAHILWGHLTSPDLVTWTPRPPALIPGAGFDRRGVWVGDWIPDTDPPRALYTGVDGRKSGLGQATWVEGGSLERGEPVLLDTPPGYQDMRDPTILRTEDGWLALVGAGALDRSRALLLAFRSGDSRDWRFVGEFDTGGAQPPGEYWELPKLLQLGVRWLLTATPVVRGEEARTLYWLGAFDGERFIPDDPDPRPLDLFPTHLAPTFARDEAGRTVAIGIMPGASLSEAERARAGWAHVLGLPRRVALVEDGGSIRQSLAAEVLSRFDGPVALEQGDRGGTVANPGLAPYLLETAIVLGESGSARVVLRASPNGEERTTLVFEPGRVGLDVSRSSLEVERPGDVRWAPIEPAERLALALVVDHSAVSGVVEGRSFGFRIFPTREDATMLRLAVEGSARFEVPSVRRVSAPLR